MSFINSSRFISESETYARRSQATTGVFLFFYAASAGGNLLLGSADPSGKQWMVSDIIGTCVLVSLFVMAPLAVIAWVRPSEQES